MERGYLVIITGASRGFGRALTLSLVQISAPLHLRITASLSSASQLASLSAEIKEQRASRQLKTTVECMTADLSDTKGLATTSSLLFSAPNAEAYSHMVFINNHGSLGQLSLAGTHDPMKMATAFDINVTSSCFLASEAIKLSKSLAADTHCQLVNVSSLCALQPFQSWSIYCAGKAAREMYYRTMAEELRGTNVKTLNYAPGPLDTDMQKEIREGADVHEETRQYFVDMKAKGTLVSPEASAAKLVRVLLKNSFESGAHVDYYDAEE